MTRLQTSRLELVAATEEFVRAEMHDRAAFEHLLRARVPENWPPEFNDINTQTFTLQQLQDQPGQVGWWAWYFLLQGDADSRVLIGNGGFKGWPDEHGSVEVGYSLLPEFQGHGYGSEAVSGLETWAFAQDVRSITAETLPELPASIRLLERNGFVFEGEGSEPGVIRYRKNRP